MFRWTKINPLDARRTHFIGTWCRRFSNSVPTWNQSGVNLFRFKLRNARIPDAVQSPRLTPQMVTSILRMNEETVEENNGPVKSYVKNQLQVSRKLDDLPSVISAHSACLSPRSLPVLFVHKERSQTMQQCSSQEAVLQRNCFCTIFVKSVNCASSASCKELHMYAVGC